MNFVKRFDIRNFKMQSRFSCPGIFPQAEHDTHLLRRYFEKGLENTKENNTYQGEDQDFSNRCKWIDRPGWSRGVAAVRSFFLCVREIILQFLNDLSYYFLRGLRPFLLSPGRLVLMWH